MLQYVLSILISAAVAVFGYAAITKPIADKMRIFDIFGSGDDFESKEIKKPEKIIIVMFFAVVSFFAAYRCLTKTATSDTVGILDTVRVLLMFIPVVCAGCIDYREKRIPNIISLFLFCEGVVFLGLVYFLNKDRFEAYAVSCLLSFAVCFILLSLVGFVTGKGIGGGDIKLLSTLGLVGGVYMICTTVIVATFACALVAVFYLVKEKRSLKSSLPYGPFVAVGFFVTVIANYY